MDYLGLQLHNIQREEQLESEIQKMKRHQHDQLDLPAILYNSMCCVQNTEQQWGSRCDCQLECTVEVVPLLFHVSIPCFLSTSICALFSVCAMQSSGGRDFLWVLVYPTSGPAAPQPQLSPFVMLPQKCSENQNSLMGNATKTTLSHTLQLPLNFCILRFFDINRHLDFCFSDSRMKHWIFVNLTKTNSHLFTQTT